MLDRGVVLAVFSAGLLAGCANGGVERPGDVSQAENLTSDSPKGEIRKRGLVVTTRTSTTKKFDPVTGKLLEETTKSVPIVCAEPSAQGIRPMPLELATKLRSAPTSSDKAIMLKDVSAMAEQQAQLTQNLGEQKYRLCEEYVGDATESPGYDLFLRRFQKNAVAALAIEHLTSASQGAAPVGGAGEIYRGLLEQREARERIAGQIAELETHKESLLKTSADTDVSALEGTILRLKADLEFFDKSIARTKDGAASGKLKVSYKADPASQRASDESVAKVAEAVGKIVRGIVQPDDRTQACMSVLQRVSSSDESLFAKWCTEAFAAENQARLLRLKALDDLRQLSHRDPRMLLRVASDLEARSTGLTDGSSDEEAGMTPAIAFSTNFGGSATQDAIPPAGTKKAGVQRQIMKASEPMKAKGRVKPVKKEG
jgi:hypothetical protein